LLLSGGATAESATHRDEAARFGGELTLFASLAQQTGSIVGVLSHALHQPMFDGMGENELLAYGFARYLATGRRDWPVLAPMTAAARRAMDAVQRLAQEAWSLEVRQFTLAGFSKRGWAAWLAATLDARVAAAVPIMMDMVDLPTQIRHQLASWGGLSDALRPFEAFGVAKGLETLRGDALLDMIDPIRWPADESAVRMLVSATNDDYWPIDSADLVADRLPGMIRRCLIPNSRHGSLVFEAILAECQAVHRHVALGETLPRLEASAHDMPGAVRIVLTSDAPASFRLWQTAAPNRDLREARWSPTALRGGSAAIALPPRGILAVFAEAEYRRDWGSFTLTSPVCQIGPQGLARPSNRR
jgi:PhoPQ-activated pathogenicity-related protein